MQIVEHTGAALPRKFTEIVKLLVLWLVLQHLRGAITTDCLLLCETSGVQIALVKDRAALSSLTTLS